jgi:hypothetical protein
MPTSLFINFGGQVKALSFAPFSESCVNHYGKSALKRIESLKPSSRWQKMARGDDPVSAGCEKSNSGWLRLKNVYKLLAKFDSMEGYTRNNMQRKAHDYYIQASLRVIMGKDFVNNVGRLRRMYAMPKLRQETLIAAPRRFGKTFATTMFCAVMLIVIGFVSIACFSTGRRASRAFLVTTQKMVDAVGQKRMISAFNEEMMMLKNPDNESDQRVIKSFPSRPEIEDYVFLISLFFD